MPSSALRRRPWRKSRAIPRFQDLELATTITSVPLDAIPPADPLEVRSTALMHQPSKHKQHVMHQTLQEGRKNVMRPLNP